MTTLLAEALGIHAPRLTGPARKHLMPGSWPESQKEQREGLRALRVAADKVAQRQRDVKVLKRLRTKLKAMDAKRDPLLRLIADLEARL